VKGGEAQRFIQNLDIPGQWWTLFHSEALNAMVEQALKNNPTLPAAEAALRLAWENVYAGEGAFFPTAVVSYSPSRNKTATGVVLNQSEGVVAASKGDVQGLLGWQPNLYRLVTMGGTLYATETTLYVGDKPQRLPDDDRLQMYHSLLLAAQSWIDGKPNTLKAVMRALLRANDLLAKDRPKALDAMEKELRVDRDALTVMADANKYSLALDRNVAASLAFVGDWAVSINRAGRRATPEEAFAPELLRSLDPSLVSWTTSKAEK
jgi:hypothetical protein